jgi:hypothetical protein
MYRRESFVADMLSHRVDETLYLAISFHYDGQTAKTAAAGADWANAVRFSEVGIYMNYLVML